MDAASPQERDEESLVTDIQVKTEFTSTVHYALERRLLSKAGDESLPVRYPPHLRSSAQKQNHGILFSMGELIDPQGRCLYLISADRSAIQAAAVNALGESTSCFRSRLRMRLGVSA